MSSSVPDVRGDAASDPLTGTVAIQDRGATTGGRGIPRVPRGRRVPGLSGVSGVPSLSRLPRSARWAAGIVVPLLLLALWQTTTAIGIFTPVQLPPPGDVVAAGADLLRRGQLGIHIWISTQRVLLGFLLGAAAGLAAGALVGLSRLSALLLGPTIGAFRAVPSLAWVPLLLLWIGIGENSKVLLIAIGAFFPVYTTVALALRHVDPHLVEAGRAFGYGGVRLLLTVQLPAILPAVVSGLRLALAQAWLFLVAAELLASSMGLGFLLIDSQNNGRTDRLLLAIVLLAILGKVTDAVLGLAQRAAERRWA